MAAQDPRVGVVEDGRDQRALEDRVRRIHRKQPVDVAAARPLVPGLEARRQCS
jgi:hypothetical protein